MTKGECAAVELTNVLCLYNPLSLMVDDYLGTIPEHDTTSNSLRNAHNVSRNDEDFVHFAHLLNQNNLDSAFRPYYTDYSRSQ
jgi:hypothetical protein